MGRTIACLGLGLVLWAAFGAVEGADDWELSASGYLIGLAVVGALVGLVAPDRHVRTGLLLVAPGAATLVVGAGDYEDEIWWLLSVALGLYAAATSHWLATELRRRIRRPAGRAGNLFRRPGAPRVP